MRKLQLVLDYFIRGSQVHPRLPWIMRHNPDAVIVTDREHSPYYIETSRERYVSADAWNMTAQELGDFIRNEGPGYSYSTPSAFAMSLWRTYFWPGDYILRADGYRFKMCRDSLYGGRCEVYQYGPGYYEQYDINSSYPAAACRLVYPDPHTIRYNHTPTLAAIDTHDGVSTVTFSQDGNVPPLPVRAFGRVLYPIADRIEGTYTHNELRYAQSAGAVIHSVQKQYVADGMLDENPFDSFVRYCYARRIEHKIWKRIANVLFGRLSINQNELYRFKLAESREQLSATPKYLKNYFGANVVATPFSPPPQGNVLWASMVLADARSRLHLYTRYAVYCDTDCIVTPSPVDVPVSSELGEWKHSSGEYDIRGAKAYRVMRDGVDTLKLKGVATATRSLADLIAAKATQERRRLPDGTTMPYAVDADILKGGIPQ